MDFEDLLNKYGVSDDQLQQSQPQRQQPAGRAAEPKASGSAPQSHSAPKQSSGGWDGSGTFGSNDNLGTGYDDGYETVNPHRRTGRRVSFDGLSRFPWLDIIFITLIVVEFVVLIINVDAVFYAILPVISNLFVILLIAAVVFIIIWLLRRRGRRRFF